MKIYIFKISLFISLILSGCGYKQQNIQYDDEAFLKFNASKSYEIVVNNDITFASKNNTSYKIKSGTNNIKAYENGTLIYEKDIFVGQSNTKIINLP